MKKRMSRRDFLKASALAGTALYLGPSDALALTSAVGKVDIDRSGSPVGVVRMDVNKSYSGIEGLLQEYLNNSSQGAWDRIKAKIDYTFENLNFALGPLETETGFRKEIYTRLEKGQKLLFKPNLVGPRCINPETNGPDLGSTTCTEWAFIAALMRWFHDKLEINYHRMALGEAGTSMPVAAASYSKMNPQKMTITPEAVLEGKIGNFNFGWGFYFARKYLAESLKSGAQDDPMQGYEESVAGTYLPPGKAGGKLMVYDLNRIYDDPRKGREIEIPDGINYKSITIHKVVVGGSAADPKDRADYPGSILINVPKFKVHAITLFTNVIKNLGIGLYPMQSSKQGNRQWDYSAPFNAIPGMKAEIPHEVWVGEVDSISGIPRKDEKGGYLVKKTGGITATMIDIINGVKNQGIYMVHVVDGIEAINYDHTGSGMGRRQPEGMVFAGLDPVATDLLCARYMFSNVPLKEALEQKLEDGNGGHFPQKVPLPTLEGKNILTRMGYDCPLARDISFRNAEKRGLGGRKYHVIGKDVLEDFPLVSVKGHLGRMKNENFSDLITKHLYFDIFKFPWDLQKTALNYFTAVDNLSGSSVKKNFLDTYDETGNGEVTYEEMGKKGLWTFLLHNGARTYSEIGTNPFGALRTLFIRQTQMLKMGDRLWNLEGHDITKDIRFGAACFTGFTMSRMEIEGEDPFIPGLKWGKGKWPGFQLAWHAYLGSNMYGNQFPSKLTVMSLFGHAFRYADLTQNGGTYSGKVRSQPNPDALDRYFSELKEGKRKQLEFIFFVPNGFDMMAKTKIPNVEVTDDPIKILTAAFANGKEIWS
jgi:hypothetical protein